jgi:hypothetical protein
MRQSLYAAVAVASALVLCAPLAASAGHPTFGEVELRAATDVEADAGVWVDGQYMGYLRELKGRNRLVLLPGEHQLVVRLIGYTDLNERIMVEPGQRREYRVTMPSDPTALYPEEGETAQLRISVVPQTAAVFVNDVYAGHVERFSGRQGARLGAGTYRVRIALPGYQPFETELTLLANQTYEIKTELLKGTIADQPDTLIMSRAAE